ncbi:MAG: RNA-binding protein, partial [Candidatus Thermoplasmatota archaeon]|nr:RNA-binding protein [Candidatus Thermoplasmatota archaeon]
MTDNKIVLPGEQVSTSEELLPGDGTFEEEGIIRSARLGTYVVDEKHRMATVKPLTSIPVEVKRGDIVLAKINSVRSNM